MKDKYEWMLVIISLLIFGCIWIGTSEGSAKTPMFQWSDYQKASPVIRYDKLVLPDQVEYATLRYKDGAILNVHNVNGELIQVL